VVFALVAVAAIIATYTASLETQRAEQSRDSIANVAETLQELAGFVPEETEVLLRRSTKAILAGQIQDTDSHIFQQVDALEEMARYFHDSWDDERVTKFLNDADQRLRRVSAAGVASPGIYEAQGGMAGDLRRSRYR
jgi:23S rRNA maturation mini-RNase III